jgi:hypothetical protein
MQRRPQLGQDAGGPCRLVDIVPVEAGCGCAVMETWLPIPPAERKAFLAIPVESGEFPEIGSETWKSSQVSDQIVTWPDQAGSLQ